MKFTREVAEQQWAVLSEEYLLEPDADLVEEERAKTVKSLRGAFIAAIVAGYVEIVDDAEKGVIVNQILRRKPAGLESEVLEYRPPGATDIARAGIGTDTKMAHSTRYLRVASALTGVPESVMVKIVGGDRSRMETIASLFLLA